jgi:hypothetical protein
MSIAQELAGSACVCVTHRQLDGVKRVPIARCGWPSPGGSSVQNAMGRDRQPWEVSGASDDTRRSPTRGVAEQHVVRTLEKSGP